MATCKANTVHFWPDGEWCYGDELKEMLLGRSDDFITFPVVGTSEPIIEEMIDYLLS